MAAWAPTKLGIILLLGLSWSCTALGSTNDVTCPFASWRAAIIALSSTTACRGCDFEDCVLSCQRCAFGLPAAVDLRTCPKTGTPRIYLTPTGLVCIQKGGVRPVAGLNGTAPPPVQLFGPPPPLEVVTASVSDAEVQVLTGHDRPKDLVNLLDMDEVAKTEEYAVLLSQKVDNATDFVRQVASSATDKLTANLRTGDVIDLSVTATVSGSGRRRHLLEAAHGSRRSLLDFSSLLLGRGSLNISNIQLKRTNGGKDFVVGGKPVNITSLTFLVRMCGKELNFGPQDIQKIYFNKFAGSGVYTLQRQHEVCSFNKLLFPPETNLIFGPIDIPCQATVTSTTTDANNTGGKGTVLKLPMYQYDMTKACNDVEKYGVWELAKQWLQQNQPAVYANIRFYKRKIVMLSFADKCEWKGLGNTGCGDGHCLSWHRVPPSYIAEGSWGANSPDMTALFHELGHNIGLNHASRVYSTPGLNTSVYGDVTDPMGSGYPDPTRVKAGPVCFTAPQAYKAGWYSPIDNPDYLDPNLDGVTSADFNLWTLQAGRMYTFTVPSMHLSDKNYIRISLDTLNNVKLQSAVFLSYRVRQGPGGFDHAMRPAFDGAVMLHEYNGTASAKPDSVGVMTGLRALLRPITGRIPDLQSNIQQFEFVKSYRSPKYTTGPEPSWLVARVVTTTADYKIAAPPKQVKVGLCRANIDAFTAVMANEETCNDDFDRDCNGVIDAEEAVCERFRFRRLLRERRTTS
ncbi:hypothetical protein HYH02_007697 [Chlamydomonas schloesseri]|uniref:Peptidase M11 gametolysin domain-containing protein n=1 Tax=Chlamydomonas schloesseri TaxID=2026947 RepID=A0A836B4W0_9CHLO|nr:hypothetical protein HYH02_007697 [Chlamydomonas schloesseri]|eukprot:KAG2447369.1 hypothetical protein HYH02_007697 [Chlamydomonas schloesseri]